MLVGLLLRECIPRSDCAVAQSDLELRFIVRGRSSWPWQFDNMAERIIPYTQHDLICNFKMSINSDCDINSGTKVLVMLSIEVKT